MVRKLSRRFTNELTEGRGQFGDLVRGCEGAFWDGVGLGGVQGEEQGVGVGSSGRAGGGCGDKWACQWVDGVGASASGRSGKRSKKKKIFVTRRRHNY